MARITNKILETMVDNINRKMGNKPEEALCLEFAYGGVRLCRHVGGTGLADVSMRMTRPEMEKVLDAMYNLVWAFDR